MKKLTSKLLCILIALFLAFSLFACKNVDDNNDGNEGDGGSQKQEFYNENEKEEVSDTETIFIANGTSDYKLVVPAGHTNKSGD